MSINPFLKQNKLGDELVEIYVGGNFVDEEGNPVPIKCKHLTSKECRDIEKGCYKKVKGKNGQYHNELDEKAYSDAIMIASIVEPDLNDKELQESYGTETPFQTFHEMLYIDEYAEFAQEFVKLIGFNNEIDALIARDESKNE